MIKSYKLGGLFITILLCALNLKAQEDIVISQYIHNQYAINPAFGGARNDFSIYGAFKKQWVGVEQSPTKQLLTVHSPLENDNMALGLKISNNTISVFKNTEITGSYTYRFHVTKKSQLAFGVNGGVRLSNTSWRDISTISENDPLFSANESATNLALGAGVAWYSNNFYTSFSAPSLLFYNEEKKGKGEFNPSKINYLFSGGYLINTGSTLAFQPSALLNFNPDKKLIWDAGATIIYNDLLWFTLGYRSLEETVVMFALQPVSSLKIGYSYDYAMGKMSGLGSGSHEISLQFDFGYKIKSSNPKFF